MHLYIFFISYRNGKNKAINHLTNLKNSVILPSLTLATIKKALNPFIIWVLEPFYMQKNVAIFLISRRIGIQN